MLNPSSNSKVLSNLIKEIEKIDTQFPSIKARLDVADKNRQEAGHMYNRVVLEYERLRLTRNRLLCELRGQDVKGAEDILSKTLYHHTTYSMISSRKLKELKKADIEYLGDLAQAKMVKYRGRPLSLHPRQADGTYREAGVPVVGMKTIVYLESVLVEHGLTYGMFLSDWIRPIRLEELHGKIWNYEEIFNEEAWQLLRKIPHGAPWAFTRHLNDIDIPAILVGDLVQMSDASVLNMIYIGPKELGYIKQVLVEHGLSLNMKLDGWVHPRTE